MEIKIRARIWLPYINKQRRSNSKNAWSVSRLCGEFSYNHFHSSEYPPPVHSVSLYNRPDLSPVWWMQLASSVELHRFFHTLKRKLMKNNYGWRCDGKRLNFDIRTIRYQLLESRVQDPNCRSTPGERDHHFRKNSFCFLVNGILSCCAISIKFGASYELYIHKEKRTKNERN